MKRFYFLISAMLTIISSASQSPAENPATQPQPVTFAERHLHVSGDEASVERVLQEFKTIKPSGRDGPVFGPDGRPQHPLALGGPLAVLGLEEDNLKVVVDSQAKNVDLLITVPQQASVDATYAADQIVRLFNQRFAGPSQSRADELQQNAQQFELLKARMDELMRRHNDQEAALRKLTGAVDVSPASVRERLASMQTQRESGTIDLAAKQARSDALAEQISKFTDQIQQKIKADPIAAELQKASDARDKEAQFRKMQFDKGLATEADVTAATAAQAEAKAKLLERQETAANTAGGDIVAGWNRELMTLSIDLAELRARSKALDERLAAYSNADEYLNNADQWLVEIADLQKQASALQEKVNSEQADYERNHVSIEVIKDSANATTRPSK